MNLRLIGLFLACSAALCNNTIHPFSGRSDLQKHLVAITEERSRLMGLIEPTLSTIQLPPYLIQQNPDADERMLKCAAILTEENGILVDPQIKEAVQLIQSLGSEAAFTVITLECMNIKNSDDEQSFIDCLFLTCKGCNNILIDFLASSNSPSVFDKAGNKGLALAYKVNCSEFEKNSGLRG